MATPASLAKHPLHTTLVPIPIGLWLISLVGDLIYLSGWGSAIWRDVAFYTITGGIIGSFLAAVPGLMDYYSLPDRRLKKLAALHMGMNFAVTLLFVINLWLRSRYGVEASSPVVLSVIGVLLLGIEEWYGGEFVYVHGVAVEPQHDIARKAREQRLRKLRLV